ncbi:hypothetical protein J2X11_001969 [Aeromicrobium panaciterrae]|uniref:Uncharacterized protein n=1 Tax=Aeromicrobium panaciterrae TaxID=363861 RepID=A0ABU1UPP3_9ACTN|nr:hypothetical protein [Aeromicrobium panaciterrae]MDR7087130.1 hypothetical protein [Aeromicrobium panaciterrae]
MTSAYLCDYCRAAIDTRTDTPLIVGVHRRVDTDEWDDRPSELVSGEELAFRYCDQQHLALHMQRIPLPPVMRDDSMPSGGVVIGVFAGFVFAAALLGLTVYGGFQFWKEVAQGWF